MIRASYYCSIYFLPDIQLEASNNWPWFHIAFYNFISVDCFFFGILFW